MTSSDTTSAETWHLGRVSPLWLIVLGTGLLTAGLGCVDTEPALKFKGFPAYPATIEEQTLTCNPGAEEGEDGGGGGTGVESYEVNYTTATCDTEVDPGDIESFQYEAGLNLAQFGQFGQPGFGTDTSAQPSLRTAVCADQKPSNSDLESETSQWFAENSGSANFTVSANIINNLEDNRNTGAQGGGGGGQGGGYEGLYADGNDVKLQTIQIRFPKLSSRYNRDVPVAAVVDTQGGAVNIPVVRVFSANQISQLEQLHRNLVLSRTDAASYGDAEERTEIVIEAEFRAIGETLSGKQVTSNDVTLPIRLCADGTACTTTGACGYTL